jgi:MFS family permease
MISLQVGFFVDYVPAWLGPTLLMLGLAVMVGLFWGMAITNARDDPQNSMSDDPERRMAFIVTFVGSLFVLIHIYLNNTFLFAGMALLAGRWIEGVSATRFIATLSSFFSDSSSDQNIIVGYVKKRAYRFGGFLLFLLLAGWVIIYGLLLGFGGRQPALQLAFGWTIVVGTISLFGLMWKFRDIYRIGAPSCKGNCYTPRSRKRPRYRCDLCRATFARRLDMRTERVEEARN